MQERVLSTNNKTFRSFTFIFLSNCMITLQVTRTVDRSLGTLLLLQTSSLKIVVLLGKMR